MKNIIFIDVDGTLVVNVNGHQYVPESAKIAIQKARQKGNLVYLCTGRSLKEIGDLKDIGFDGMIAGAGCYIDSQGKVLKKSVFRKEDVDFVLDYLKERGIYFYLESHEGNYCSDGLTELLIKEVFNGDDSSEFLKMMIPVGKCPKDNINKISFISTQVSFDSVYDDLINKYSVVRSSWGPKLDQAGEIGQKGINKATAIQELLKSLDIKDVKTYAFGDSMNDREMFESVDVSIAMGNYSHGIEKYASYITKDILDDGIYDAMEHFDLI